MGSLLQNATALLATTALAGGFPYTDKILHIDCGCQFAKAIPRIEGGERVLYLEASSQARDLQDERILAEALAESKDYFLRYGRIDLDHASIWQAIRESKLDPQNPYAREIGQPKEVRIKDENGDPKIYVKAEIFRSSDPNNEMAKAANWFWDSLQVSPPVRWFPSVAGTLLGAKHDQDPDGRKIRVIHKIRWHSIALTATREPRSCCCFDHSIGSILQSITG